MTDVTETRELFTLDVDGMIVRGTFHRPWDESANKEQGGPVTHRLGVAFLNSLSPTRAATGDSAVYWADALAKQGYPCFRFDLLGFGDSDGNPPDGLMSYINSGGYSSLAATILEKIVRRFGLSGVVVAGLCAGAVSGLFTAEVSRNCQGVVLMDPYFYLPMESKKKLPHRIWVKLTGRISRTACGRLVSRIYDRGEALWKSAFSNGLPSNANVSLLCCWERLASSGLPILILNASGKKPRKGEFDYLAYILRRAGRGGRVEVNVVEGTGHTFSNRAGRSAVRSYMQTWLNSSFFPSVCGDTVAKPVPQTRSLTGSVPRVLEMESFKL